MGDATMPIGRLRSAEPSDVDAIARIWYDGWRDGHLGSVPDDLVVTRTPEDFAKRAPDLVPNTVVAEVDGTVAGFVTVVGDELDQVYVADAFRGSGIADVLLGAGVTRVAASGHSTAWLAVVPGNDRARSFYARNGWVDEGAFDYPAPAGDGAITVTAHRYTKRV